VIKANISSRIAFAVASQVDSRTILDVNGAERLIGHGDMLFHPIDAPKPVRIQGAFLSEEEANRVVEMLTQTHEPTVEYELDLEAVDADTQTDGAGRSEERDDLFEQALALIRRRRQASASMLQREFEIGYPRAGRIIDQLEQAGYISPQEGSKPRQVLMGEPGEGIQGDGGEDTVELEIGRGDTGYHPE
jgi:S-DNA-T family DNA segregation ATPase FtsK/SpoIIIE